MKHTMKQMKRTLAAMNDAFMTTFERCRSVFSQTYYYQPAWRQENALIPLIISPKRTAHSPEYRPDLYELEP